MNMQRPSHVLIIDDEAAVRLTLEALLRRRGYVVTTAENGTEALTLLLSDAFDLLLIDLKLPGMSGLEIAQYARAHQSTVAILILTGSTEIAGLPLEEQVGPFEYLMKTASPQEVLDRVAALVQRRGTGAR